MSTRRSTLPRFALATALAGVAALVSTTAAQADVPTVSASTGTLVARGAAVSVPITVTCNTGYGWIYPELTQRHGNSITQGGANGKQFTCTGTAQTVDVLIRAYSAPFRAGQALLSGNVEVCDNDAGCTYTSINRIIQISR